MFDKVLNMFLNWLSKLRMFFLGFFHVLQVTDNLLLGKNKRKEPTELQNN